MSAVGKYDLPPIRSGDTWSGVNRIRIVPASGTFSGTLAKVLAQVRKEPDAREVAWTLDSGRGNIVIEDDSASVWEVSIPKQIPPIHPGTYVYDMVFVDSAGNVQTLLEGAVTVETSITR